MKRNDISTVKSLDRGLDILEYIATARHSPSFSQLLKDLEIPRSSLFRTEPSPIEGFDLYATDKPNAPVNIFIHGGALPLRYGTIRRARRNGTTTRIAALPHHAELGGPPLTHHATIINPIATRPAGVIVQSDGSFMQDGS
jgi:hypothetical protein